MTPQSLFTANPYGYFSSMVSFLLQYTLNANFLFLNGSFHYCSLMVSSGYKKPFSRESSISLNFTPSVCCFMIVLQSPLVVVTKKFFHENRLFLYQNCCLYCTPLIGCFMIALQWLLVVVAKKITRIVCFSTRRLWLCPLFLTLIHLSCFNCL